MYVNLGLLVILVVSREKKVCHHSAEFLGSCTKSTERKKKGGGGGRQHCLLAYSLHLSYVLCFTEMTGRSLLNCELQCDVYLLESRHFKYSKSASCCLEDA